MSMIRRVSDPFRELARMESEMQKIFDDVFGNRRLTMSERVYAPLVDLRETENEFIIEADLPGFKKDEIKIEVTRESVEISASHQEEKEEKEEGKYLHRERCAYKFMRQIALPSPIDTEKIKTAFKDGTLKLEIEKEPGTTKKTIKL